jgi:phospholipid/cholesterol/gamma-HCH transport system substrate-binding protein
MQGRKQTGLTSEMYIGLFALVALIFLAGFLIWFKSLSFGPQQRFTICFPEIGGLKPNAPVTISGVRVGTVDRIDLKGVRRVYITVRLDPHVMPITKDAHFDIETFGLLGAKYLEIEPAEPEEGKPQVVLTEKTIAMGEEPVVVEKVLNRLGKGINALNLEKDSAVLERSLEKLEKLEDTMYTTSDKFGHLATDVRSTNKRVDNALASTDLKKTLTNMQDASDNINKAAKQTNQILDTKHPLLHMIFGRPGHIKEKEVKTTVVTKEAKGSDPHGADSKSH